MSDLIRRLRRLGTDSVGHFGMPICDEAADRIEALEAQVREQALNYLSLDGQAEMLGERIKADEALLRQALEALEYRQSGDPDPHIPEAKAIAAIRARLED